MQPGEVVIKGKKAYIRPEERGWYHQLLVFLGLRPRIPPRRPVCRGPAAVFAQPDAIQKVRDGLKFAPPSSVFRWDKFLRFVNSEVECSEEEPDPIRIELDMDGLKAVCRFLYNNTTKVNSDGFALMREFLPKMYDKHSLERGLRVSQAERDERGITDDGFAYGELDPEMFATIYTKVSQAYGTWSPKGIFYDLGCGVGNLVYSAAFIGDFVKVGGIENIQALLDRGEKRMPRWERFKQSFTNPMQKMRFIWEQDNFIENPSPWADGTFVLLHWTALNREQIETMGTLMNQLREGCIVVSFTNPVPNTDFEILVKDACVTSWGKADFYIQEKLTPRKPLAGREYKEEDDYPDDDDIVPPTADEAEFMF